MPLSQSERARIKRSECAGYARRWGTISHAEDRCPISPRWEDRVRGMMSNSPYREASARGMPSPTPANHVRNQTKTKTPSLIYLHHTGLNPTFEPATTQIWKRGN